MSLKLESVLLKQNCTTSREGKERAERRNRCQAGDGGKKGGGDENSFLSSTLFLQSQECSVLLSRPVSFRTSFSKETKRK